MLAFVALLAFALLGMAALTIDLGFAAMQQLRIESAAESAALIAHHTEARIRFGVERGAILPEVLDCAETREDCIVELSRAAAEPTIRSVLGEPEETDEEARSPDEVDLGPSELDPGPGFGNLLESCGEHCWEAWVEQAVPLLFGQASMLGFEGGTLGEMLEARSKGSLLVDDGGGPRAGALRTAGVPIDALVRVESRPALRIGLAQPAVALPGRGPFALNVVSWAADFQVDVPVRLDADATEISLRGTTTAIGRRIGGAMEGLEAGRVLALPSTPLPLGAPGDDFYAYIPLLDGPVVIGFGFARIEVINDSAMQVSRVDMRVAPGNASAALRHLVDPEILARVEDLLAAQSTHSGVLLQAAVLR